MGACETGGLESPKDRPGKAGADDGGRLRAIEWTRRHLARPRAVVHRLPAGRHVWRVAIAALGGAVVLAGIVMLVLPGPGWVVIFIGFGIWATEFAWADSTLAFARRKVASATSWIRRRFRSGHD
jgi:uncharacterized protein (TIGR02611 family)